MVRIENEKITIRTQLLPTKYPEDVLQTIGTNGVGNYEQPISLVKAVESKNLTRLDQNPNARGMLSMMSLIAFSETKRLSAREIVAQRQTGAPPARTEYELGMLVESELLNEKDGEFSLTNIGNMEIKRNEMMDPRQVKETLKSTLEEIKSNPPKLPPEVYSKEEFRWSWETVHSLVERILQNNAFRKLDIALLGAPTIALFLSRCPELVNHVSMFDINAEMVDLVNKLDIPNIHAAEYDAVYPIHPATIHNYDVVITDPPWHVEYYMLFADRAWEWLRPLGEAYVAFFSHETRPEAGAEIKQLRTRFDHGFEQWGFEERVLGYEIPTYEAAAFEKQGVHATKRANYGALMHLVREVGPRSEPCLTVEAAGKLINEHTINLSNGNSKHVDVYIRREDMNSDQLFNEKPSIKGGEVFENTSRSSRREAGINVMNEHHQAWTVNYPGLFAIVGRQLLEGLNRDVVATNLLILGTGVDNPTVEFADQYVTMVVDFLESQSFFKTDGQDS